MQHSSEVGDHVAEARSRARKMLGGEAHLGDVDDWRRTLVSARDSIILLLATWAGLHGLGHTDSGGILVVLSVAIALLMGISTGRSTWTQAQYHASELERERYEIRHHFDHECDEIRELYAAKGLQEPLLSQVVEVLTSDEDRLLKIMMEEELGLRVYHMNHPLVVGLWNGGASLIAGGLLAVPAMLLSTDHSRIWIMTGAAVLFAVLAIVSARATRRSAIEFFAVGLLTSLIIGGVSFFLAQSLAGMANGVVVW